MPTHFPVGLVSGVFASATHSFSKVKREFILLLPGLRVDGDAHSGTVVQHVYDKNKQSGRPNLRQIYLVQVELIDQLNQRDFKLRGGDLGENISTRRVDLLALSHGTLLRPETAVVRITGLRVAPTRLERRVRPCAARSRINCQARYI